MILLVRPVHPDGLRAIAVFGVGLIGRDFLNTVRVVSDRATRVDVSWREPARRRTELTELSRSLATMESPVGPIRRLDVVWTAGRAGFGADRQELSTEIDALRDVVDWVRDAGARFPQAVASFHMLSSAGGLFEGQRFVDHSSKPRPRRPYGEAKLMQEQIALDLDPNISSYVYRPSSVYGYSGAGGRVGLLTNLLENAIRQHQSRIFGDLHTVRDYVFLPDVTRYIARCVESSVGHPRVALLASGKPSSISEIIRIVRKIVGRPLSLKLDLVPSNAYSTTYRPSALPPGWRATDLETGIRLMAKHMAKSFVAGAGSGNAVQSV